MIEENVVIGLALTLLAGLSTGIGSLIAFFGKRTSTRFLSAALGFSAGVMLYVSFMDILPESRHTLAHGLDARSGGWIAVLSFFGGMAVIGLIDRLVPSVENPHEMHYLEEMRPPEPADRNHHLLRMGLFSAAAIALHNFPEGIATFVSANQDPKLGLTIALAIAIHNIPEGIAVSVPVYWATGSKNKALAYSFLSGLAEPAGAVLGYVLLIRFMSDALLGVLLGGVAGVMVFVALDELLPSAQEYGEHHLSIYGLTVGMAVMAVSLLLFN